MKKLYASFITAIILTIFCSFSTYIFGQYRPVIPGVEAIYLSEPLETFKESYAVRSTLDSQKISTNQEVYYPYRTLTDENYNSFECTFIYTNNWMGDSIVHQLDSNSFVFHFTPIRFNELSNSYELSEQDSFEISGNITLNTAFLMNEYIQTKLISEKTQIWNGIQLKKRTFKLTNLGNSDYKWEDGVIEITEDHGIYNFPNLQYFPYEWRNCTLAGLADGKKGLQDFTAKEAYRMAPGDEYTAERRFYYAGPNFIQYYDKITCIEIIEENDTFQNRIVKKERLQLNPSTLFWDYTVENISERIEYENQVDNWKANAKSPDQNLLTTMVILRANGHKFSNDYVNSDSSFCYHEYIDGCYNNFALNAGFDNYYDCGGIFSFEDSYLLIHRIVNGVGIGGGGGTFDSIKTLKTKVLDNVGASIYPNPSNGFIAINSNKINSISSYYLIDIAGNRIKIEPIKLEMNAISFDITLSGIFYLIGTDNSGNIFKLGKVIVNNDH